ncbi:hypothetical protein SAMN06296036_112155 [Pseudobacteriovorax antillogorgiicola]|uniref:Uncharacterized protein n=2 Tax=Pseudobacteriovorax antillogorgiicola TaxID=1513793 RepID=A0A1Y6C821_9BACT|nr:hypothetical protein EDD56_112156 [Pseudobacteriovorax antillogorgiicola]SMF41348.1 hypothetical protein SAMN06296036_112155 [Pseudobacteriovorax antillogorgiicola]
MSCTSIQEEGLKIDDFSLTVLSPNSFRFNSTMTVEELPVLFIGDTIRVTPKCQNKNGVWINNGVQAFHIPSSIEAGEGIYANYLFVSSERLSFNQCEFKYWSFDLWYSEIVYKFVCVELMGNIVDGSCSKVSI